MSALPNLSNTVRVCPFCGLVADVNHETQEGCIAALQEEIARMRSVLAHLQPAGPPEAPDNHPPAQSIRLSLD